VVVTLEPNGTISGAATVREDLAAGVFAITPLNSRAKSVAIDSFSLVVATAEPLN
jgi:hypothetical protein